VSANNKQVRQPIVHAPFEH